MTTVFQASRDAYVARQLLARRALLATRRLWLRLDPKEIRYSWRFFVGPDVLRVVSAAQQEAAAAADAAVAAMLTAQGVSTDTAGPVYARAFAGVASDGRDLATLLELSNMITLKQIGGGSTPKQALINGGQWLEMVVGTQISDASRAAVSVATTARHHVDGFYRVLNPPSCDRCAVLAGRWYRWDAGFERHPRCDCGQVPADDGSLDDHPELWTPQKYFESLSKADQDRLFGAAGAQSIRDGADISRVVNARDGMYTATQYGKPVSATYSGIKFRQGGVRLMPEQIYREANGNRAEAIRLLQRFGYIR